MYKKIYISLDNVWDDVTKEINEYNFLLKEKNISVIWNHFRIKKKIEDREKFMISVFSLELYLLVNYLDKNGYDLSKIEILQDKPMFIYNDDLYKIENNNIVKLETENVWFFSVRWTNWNYPFFFILEKIICSKGWNMEKTNNLNRNVLWKWKFYALNSLYLDRKNLIWDILIPYKISKQDYKVFIEFIETNIWHKIVLKKDSTQLWQWVIVVDLEKYDQKQQEKFEKMMLSHKDFWKEVYIIPYKKFKEEYRIYFTKYAWNIRIFSLKKKVVTSSEEEIFNAETFEYYKNVMLSWSYIENRDWDENLIKISKEYISKLEYTTWALEFWKMENWDLMFFEVNSMADPICYEWEDMNNMSNYYNNIFDNFFVNYEQ